MYMLIWKQDILLILFALLLPFLYLRRRTAKGKLPPGPKPLPFIGNKLPRKKDWETYTEWGNKYGDIVYAHSYGKPIIILNSYKAAYDLMESRSSIYSDRPHLIVLMELMGFPGTVFQPYSNLWRKHRSLYHKQMNQVAVKNYQPTQMATALDFLKMLLENPKDYVRHIRSIAYGRDLTHRFDQYLDLSDQVSKDFFRAVRPGEFLVESFPILKHVPPWFPGSNFQRWAKKAHDRMQATWNIPFRDVKEQMAKGNVPPSFVANSLVELGRSDESDFEVGAVKSVAGGIFAAGTDTTTAALSWFFLTMALFPDCQVKAQEELDRVTGRNRIPQFSDRPFLPYIDGLVKEVFRWFPVAPSGLSHYTTEDNIYEGYLIPAHSIVLANAWKILHDPEVYPDPMSFKPERFLPDKDGNVPRDPAVSGVFGFGRRICAGRHLAEGSVWIMAASVLSLFNIRPATDSDGKPIDVRYAMEPLPGFFCHPQRFPCVITPRSQDVVQLLNQVQF
ncbi:hypothetical protein Clacol_002365 [Clathrus columnatus]|uniref:Cytochrome P450 n=1 Tax=Clathrus columnatus TaxID=1419009 RepID=A0AAV5A3Y7_9AGAM|nr:hypothetical protein Clacol_002365 [Clathrus columnatus]